MGCFFACFRNRDDNHHNQTHLASEPVLPKAREPVISRNALSSFLLTEEKDGFPCTEKENPDLATPQRDNIGEQLKDEARFLKACGTLLETPAEFRKAPAKFKDPPHYDGDLEPLKYHSWLPNISMEKLNFDKQPDQPPTPIKICEEWVKGSCSLEHTPSSSISDNQNAGRIPNSFVQGSGVGSVSDWASSTTTSSLTDRDMATNFQQRNKSVRFECKDGVNLFSAGSSSSEIANENISKQLESGGQYSLSRPSPYPTPLKLTDEMQTPGTVFPANAKNRQIRSHYVYSVQNPVENLSQWKVLKEEDSNAFTLSGHLRESLEQADTSTPESEVKVIGATVEKELKVEASLSSWLKPPSTNQDDNSQLSGSISIGKDHVGRTPGDRPIIGMVAAHWNEEEPSRISPKYWDGNGIPNSTNKYKEDQKVSWHATPFEERLEKALSDETSTSQRKHINGVTPIGYEETEETDTALSQLQSSTHSKPVVSF